MSFGRIVRWRERNDVTRKDQMNQPPGREGTSPLVLMVDDDPGGQEHIQDTIPQDGRSFRLKATASF